LRVGGGQHKFQILGWLFQRLQHGVERRVGEHVHLVDHEDLKAPLHRLVDRLLQQGLHLVHTAVAGGVQLGVIHKTATINIHAGLAHATRVAVMPPLPSGPWQLSDLARMRETVVLPTPRVPVNR
jgi:hypothetical protein